MQVTHGAMNRAATYLAEVRAQEKATCWVLHALAQLHKVLEHILGLGLLALDVQAADRHHKVAGMGREGEGQEREEREKCGEGLCWSVHAVAFSCNHISTSVVHKTRLILCL